MGGHVRLNVHAQIVYRVSDFFFIHESGAIATEGLGQGFGGGKRLREFARLIFLLPTGGAGVQESGDGEKYAVHVSPNKDGHGIDPIVQGAVVKGDDHGWSGLFVFAGNNGV
jgi:hypothetical protein